MRLMDSRLVVEIAPMVRVENMEIGGIEMCECERCLQIRYKGDTGVPADMDF